MINSLNIQDYNIIKSPIPPTDDGGYLEHKESTPLKPLTNDIFERNTK